MTKDRQQAFGDLEGKSQEGAEGGEQNAQGGADGEKGGNEGAGKADDGNSSQKGSKEPEKKYTDDDIDRIVNRAIAKERAKAEKAVEDERNKLTEAQKLEKMNDQEKAEYKAKKLQDEIDQLKREKNLNEQMAVARKALADEGIKIGDKLLSMFVSPEAEKTKTAITEFVSLWREELNAGIQEGLKRTPPPANGGKGQVKSDGAKYADKYNQKFNPNQGGN